MIAFVSTTIIVAIGCTDTAKKSLAKAKASKDRKDGQSRGRFYQSEFKANKNSQAGDLGSERGVMREARQRNAKGSKQVAEYGWGVANVTYRKDGKLENAAVNVRNNAKIPKSGYMFMGDAFK